MHIHTGTDMHTHVTTCRLPCTVTLVYSLAQAHLLSHPCSNTHMHSHMHAHWHAYAHLYTYLHRHHNHIDILTYALWLIHTHTLVLAVFSALGYL